MFAIPSKEQHSTSVQENLFYNKKSEPWENYKLNSSYGIESFLINFLYVTYNRSFNHS